MSQYFVAGLPVLLLFSVGFLLNKINFFKDNTIVELKNLVLYVTLPTLLFTTFLNAKINASEFVIPIIIIIYCLVILFIGFAIKKIFKIESPYFPFLISGYELGMYGYAVFIALYGQHNLWALSFLDIGHTLFIFAFFITIYQHKHHGSQSPLQIVKTIFLSPLIIAIFLGMAFANIPALVGKFPDVLNSVVVTLAAATVPLIGIAIGYQLKVDKSNLKMALATIGVRKVVNFSAALLLLAIYPFEPIYQKAILTLALTPPVFLISIIAAKDEPRHVNYINTTISIDSVLSLFLMIAVAMVYR
ncbi:MAG: AEC family transporter [Bacteroidia bacterium]|nr:AEC family transporter [Bacteroidia bacterium]